MIKAAPHTLIQYSGIEAFELREYDGSLSVAKLSSYGDFGLGCFNALDGELIYFNGKSYHAISDGTLKKASDQSLISCAYLTTFVPKISYDLTEISNISSLNSYIKKSTAFWRALLCV